MLTDEQRAAGWIEHDGGPCPVAGNVYFMLADGFEDFALDAHSLRWEWTPDRKGFQCIVAYKPVHYIYDRGDMKVTTMQPSSDVFTPAEGWSEIVSTYRPENPND